MSPSAKVGALVLVGLVVAGWFILHIESEAVDGARGRRYRVRMADAQGLIDKSPVFVRGVRVGRVLRLRLVGDEVEGEMLLRPEVTLREGAAASVASVGLLGQKQLVVSPGRGDGEELPEGTLLQGSVATSLDDVLHTMGEIGSDVKEVTASVRATVTSPENTAEAREILKGLSGAVAQVEKALALNQDELRATVKSVERFAHATAALVSRLDGWTARAGGEGTGGSGGELSSLVSRLNATAGNLEEVTGRVRRGEGPVGQLLAGGADGGTLGDGVRSLQEGMGQLSGALTALEETQLSLGMRGDWLAGRGQAKGFLQLQVKPPGNAFLRLEAVGEPFGLQSEQRAEDGSPLRTYQAPLAFSAQLGYRPLQPLQLRAGLTESRLGAGVDALLFDDRLRLSADGWDFARGQLRPHLRLEAAWTLYRPLYVLAGWDDPLNGARGLSSAWVGAGLWMQLGGAR